MKDGGPSPLPPLSMEQQQCMGRYRQNRLRKLLDASECDGLLLLDPMNVRYATGTRNQQVFNMHLPARYALMVAGGPTLLFEFPGTRHVALDSVEYCADEICEPILYHSAVLGSRDGTDGKAWAQQIAGCLRTGLHQVPRRLAVDRLDVPGFTALQAQGLTLVNGESIVQRARYIKSPDELHAMRRSVKVCEDAMENMRMAMQPGMTEQAIWSHLHQSAVANGAEWFETRLLASGERTNPWFQECGERVVEEGDIVAFDTDLVGPYGYCADISRTWVCGETKATDDQRRLYAFAHERLHAQLAAVKAGVEFREFSEHVGQINQRYLDRRYTVLCHGIGMVDEGPFIPFWEDFERWGNDGRFEVGATVCVEFFAGEVGGKEGVKLEEQIVITEGGYERLSNYRYELDWL